MIFDTRLLVSRRDRIAARGAPCDFLLAHASEDLAQRLRLIKRTFPHAVNLGAYNGLLGRHLRGMSGITSMIDFEPSAKMLLGCEGPKVCGDLEALPFRDASLDLVVSGLALQFINDLPGVLVQVRRALKPDGLFLGTLLGGQTLWELREAFVIAEEEISGGASPRVAPFVDVRDAGALLQRAGFALPVADSDQLTVTYESPFSLFKDLKSMGASNPLAARRRAPATRALLVRAAEIYQERFQGPDGRVPATFEMITMTGWCPHPDQQKPLPPGSAQMSLADALGGKRSPNRHDRNE